MKQCSLIADTNTLLTKLINNTDMLHSGIKYFLILSKIIHFK